jgi:hypothetical protein
MAFPNEKLNKLIIARPIKMNETRFAERLCTRTGLVGRMRMTGSVRPQRQHSDESRNGLVESVRRVATDMPEGDAGVND